MRRCVDKRYIAYALATLVLLLLFVGNLFYGSIDIPAKEVLSIVTGGECQRDVWRVVVLETRLPQALTALLPIHRSPPLPSVLICWERGQWICLWSTLKAVLTTTTG